MFRIIEESASEKENMKKC